MTECSGFSTFGQFLQSHGMGETLSCFFQRAPVDPKVVGENLWLIIALPLLGAVISGVFGRMLGRANTALVACGAVFGAFLVSLVAFWTINDHWISAATPYAFEGTRYTVAHDFGTWFKVGSFAVNFGLKADHLSGSMLLVITGVGFLIHLYSAEYMSHDDGYWRYFAYLNLFVAMMLTLVLADSMVLLFVGWEGVGLCSYLLIGFWYTDSQKAWAGRKAFVTNRIGDFGFLVGMFLLVLVVEAFNRQAGAASFERRGAYDAAQVASKWRDGVGKAGPLNFSGLEEMSRTFRVHPQLDPESHKPVAGQISLRTPIVDGPLKGVSYARAFVIILLCFLLGAAGKSAQLPLYVWLPDAMAGPTPVSALIHAATMVTAGVYLFCRISFLLVLSPGAMAAVALVGALTALFAALIAFAQNDIKKVLAYSTVSQLGLMFLGVGMGVFWAAFLHVVTHAFFKACLFLGAGSVMHGNADETDITKLGGLRKQMRWTWLTFLIATLAITGIVPLSGFFSKDAILDGVHARHIGTYEWVTPLAWGLGLAAAACTAFYMTRLYWLTFEGERSKQAKAAHAHESGPAILTALVVLAVLSVVAIFQGLPLMHGHEVVMENFLSPVFHTAKQNLARVNLVQVHPEEGLPWGAWLRAWLIAVGSGGVAYYLYSRVFPKAQGQGPAWARFVRKAAQNKFWVDEAYDLVIIRPIKFTAFLLHRVVDALVIDTVGVRGTAWVTARLGAALRYVQTGDIQSYATAMVLALVGGLFYALFKVLQ